MPPTAMSKLDLWASRVLTLAALVIAVAIVRREFWPTAETGAVPESVTFEKDWKELLPGALTVGDSLAPAHLIEFVDFECPSCKTIHESAVRPAQQKFGNRLAVSYIHTPLPQHRFAKPTAQAAECAAAQGRAREMVDELFAEADSFGLKPWTEYAKAAGVRDQADFGRCIRQTALAARIDSSYNVAIRRGVKGTPTFLLNGWRIPTRMVSTDLDRMVERVLAGRDPH